MAAGVDLKREPDHQTCTLCFLLKNVIGGKDSLKRLSAIRQGFFAPLRFGWKI